MEFTNYVSIFKALGQETRMRIMKILTTQEMCVCEMEAVLEMSQPRISQHLKILREAELINDRSEGPWHIYSVNWNTVNAVVNHFGEFMHASINGMLHLKKEAANIDKLRASFRASYCQLQEGGC